MFVEGETYTRKQIADELGGSLQWYLPTKDGQVVCGCFRTDINEQAPAKVSVGEGTIRVQTAQQAVDQNRAIPIFLKRATNDWGYVGMWKPVKFQFENPKMMGDEIIVGSLILEPA